MAASVEKDTANEEVVSFELPAPPGWKKKVLIPLFFGLSIFCFLILL